MALPKISQPLIEIEIPSKNLKVPFRPYLTKEEKILLLADNSNDPVQVLLAVKQIISNCSSSEDFDVDSLTSFDLVYVFLKLRAVSVDNIMKLSYKDLEDDEVRNFTLDLDKLEVIYPDVNPSNIIQASDTIKIRLKYPSISFIDAIKDTSSEVELLDRAMIACVDTIYDDEEVYDEYTEEELLEFLDNLPRKALDAIQEFYNSSPKVEHRIEYINKKGNKQEIVLSTLKDFFQWR